MLCTDKLPKLDPFVSGVSIIKPRNRRATSLAAGKALVPARPLQPMLAKRTQPGDMGEPLTVKAWASMGAR